MSQHRAYSPAIKAFGIPLWGWGGGGGGRGGRDGREGGEVLARVCRRVLGSHLLMPQSIYELLRLWLANAHQDQHGVARSSKCVF